MSARDSDSNITQRRALRPASEGDTGPVSACLVVLQGQRLGQRVDLGDAPLIIGRAPECDFQILDRSISRRHVVVWQDQAGYWIKDLDSTNQTQLNDQPVIEAGLKDGDHIAIGNSVLKFMERASVEARYHEEIYQLATVDPLTGLYNRRHFMELLERELARIANRDDRPLTLLILDLDHFKQVNDRYGHAAGDAVLKQVAAALQAGAREDCIVARIGGEEFSVLLPEQGIDAARVFAQDLCTRIAALDLDVQCVGHRITASIGVAAWSPWMTSASELLRNADEALYCAKQAGRNRVCVEQSG